MTRAVRCSPYVGQIGTKSVTFQDQISEHFDPLLKSQTVSQLDYLILNKFEITEPALENRHIYLIYD